MPPAPPASRTSAPSPAWPRRSRRCPTSGSSRSTRPTSAPSRLGEKEKAAAKLDPALLAEPAEKEVADALAAVEPQIAAALETSDFEAAVEAGARLGPVLHTFFEDVLVMAEDPKVRENRLRLLLDVRDTLGALGDLAQIPR